MSNFLSPTGLLRRSYFQINNLEIKYNSVVCSSCQIILKADYRFITDHCNMDSHKRKTVFSGHYYLGPVSKKLKINRIQDANVRRYDITVDDNVGGLKTETKYDNPYLTPRSPNLYTQTGEDNDAEPKCNVAQLNKERDQLFGGKKTSSPKQEQFGVIKSSLLDSRKGENAKTTVKNKRPTILQAKCDGQKKLNTKATRLERSVVNYEDVTYEEEERPKRNLADDSNWPKSMGPTKTTIDVLHPMRWLRSSYVEANNLIIKYNCIVCSSCQIILKADYRFITGHCGIDSHKRKTIASGRFYLKPKSEKLNIKRIQDANARRYDITVDDNAVGLKTEKKYDDPYLTPWSPNLYTQADEDDDAEPKCHVAEVKKEHDQLFDVCKGAIAKTMEKNKKPTVILATLNSPKESNIDKGERPIVYYEDVTYRDEEKMNQSVVDESKYRYFKSTNVTSTKFMIKGVRTIEDELFVRQQNNVSIREDNVYFCEACNVVLESGRTHLKKHIKTKSHCRLLTEDTRKYFATPKKYAAKQLFFHGLYELGDDLFYCKRCDVILDGSDASNITTHCLTIDHNYALSRHLEKLYDDKMLSLEYNIDSEKLEASIEPAEIVQALEEDERRCTESRPSVFENNNIDYDKFDQLAIKETPHVYTNKLQSEFRGANNSARADTNLCSNRVEKKYNTEEVKPPGNANESLSEIGPRSSSETNCNNCDNSDESSDRTEDLLKKLVIGLPQSEKNGQREDFATDVAVKRFKGIKGVQAAEDDSITVDKVSSASGMESTFQLPELDPIILNKSSVTLCDDDRINSKCLLVSDKQKSNLYNFINGI